MTCGNVLFLLGFARHSCRARLDGVYRYAAKRGMKIRVVENAYSRTDLAELIEFWEPAGIICSCGFGMGKFSPKMFGNIPVVYYDAPPGRGKCTAVMSDGEQIGRAAAQELLRLGYPSAAFVPFFEDLYWSRERGRAFIAEMNAVGVRCTTFGGAAASSAMRMKSLSCWLKSLPRPCGVFAANDIVAEEVAVAAERAGLRIPRGIALVGVDNHEQLCVNLPVPLTSIQVDFEQGGYLATDKLAGLIDGTIKAGDCPTQFRGWMHSSALWPRALNGDEVLRAIKYPHRPDLVTVGVADGTQREFNGVSVDSWTPPRVCARGLKMGF